ncbi:hypothetical protein SERLA73DRAFT_170413 [Serpula lacrymans var. lacrymans S7.3]|uniref:Chromosome segregation in meiosis protein n=2 Tax=Serpula lacrymans var. lacrymans TaxID=341189 RepID=F8Q5T5_SERL3|nr:uncharacterized protein SERLADRAFT_417068 [Serpula lacrymans var. lacrymans S7.9]EGN95973.1 hypothetical protein SERLA73DRAFT_170413 [Serpula lacrymans var. lacrymans S7.3]EGO21498.1 hypothetical protein SERLADRAFT_417068 [Serpula lacrymans var. lacrymans S7.9]
MASAIALEDIWDAPILPSNPPHISENQNENSSKNPLFLSSDSDNDMPQKAAKPSKPDIDAMFEDLDEDDDLAFKPLAPALDLEALRREATAKHSKNNAASASQATLTGTPAYESQGKHDETQNKKDNEDDKKERKKLPKLDDARLLGPSGFPQLIRDTKNFVPRGKGHEAADLKSILQIYQFWTHKMFPKTQFRDTVDRVEKLCHSKRMHVALSVWRDEAKGLVNGQKPGDDDSAVDLTSDVELAPSTKDIQRSASVTRMDDHQRSSSRPPSLPPSSSEPEDDDFDIDAVIREEEERAAAMKADSAMSASVVSTTSIATPSTNPQYSNRNSGVRVPDLDDEDMWEALDAFEDPLLDTPSDQLGVKPASLPAADAQGEDEDMWDIAREIEHDGMQSSNATSSAVPLSREPSSANTSIGTNDEGWDDMYL